MNNQKITVEELDALSRGDIKAFDTLFMSYFPKVKTFLISFLESEMESEDLAQDVFIKIWNARSRLSDVVNINAYIYRITKNTLYTYLKSKSLTVNLNDIKESPTTEDIERIIYAEELQELIDVAVENMPEQRKRIFRLSRKEGMSNDEIADKLQISKRTVETHISAALSILRKVVSSLSLF